MKKNINSERIEGRVYQHNLTIKTVQNKASENFGKEFISGTLEVAVDEEGLNVIPVHFTYVTPTTGSGNKNQTYENLKAIYENKETWVDAGKDNAKKVRIDTALALNDFYNQQNELVSTKVNEGGFVTFVNTLGPEEERNTFAADMIITKVTRTEADPDNNKDEFVTVKGAIFNFRNNLLPVDFIVRHKDGMDYFENMNASSSEPVYTKVWGKITCNTIVREIKEDSAFGESSVRTYENKTKEWTITGTAMVPYEFGEEGVITTAELEKAMQDRETLLAETKARSDEYRASKATTTTTTTVAPTQKVLSTQTPVKAGSFNF